MTTKKVIKTDKAPLPIARYSQGIIVGNTLYIQGIIALDPNTGELIKGDIKAQTRRIFESIRAILNSAEMDFNNVIKVTAFLSNLEHYQEFNEVYNSYFDFDQPPVRTTIKAEIPFNALLEVDTIAYSENK